MNKRGHIIFSLGLLTFLIILDLNWHFMPLKVEWLIYLIPLLIGSVFPDIVERAKGNPGHRGFFHSRRMVIIITIFLTPLAIFLSIKSSSEYYFLVAFLVGYLLHLVGDSLTSRLPH